MKRILIVGGGISGLALAYRLEQRLPQTDVLILEQSSRVGGTVHTEEEHGFVVESGPNGFLDNKPTTLQLSRELGLEGNLVAANKAAAENRFLFSKGKLNKLPSSLWSFLRSDLIGCRAKLSLLTERLRRSVRPDGDESIYDFVCRRAGREVAETLADAFVTGIFAGDVRQLSLRAAFPQLDQFERDYGSILKGLAIERRQRREQTAPEKASSRGSQLWSFRQGLKVLPSTLEAKLKNSPLLGVEVIRIEHTEQGWRVLAEGDDQWVGDAVVLTCPAYSQSAMLADLDHKLAERIKEINYSRLAVVALGFQSMDVPIPVKGFGYLTPGQNKRDALGVLWASSIFPDRAPSGTVLLRAMCGGAHRPEIVDWEDDRLLNALQVELAQTMQIRAKPLFHRIVRWPRAIPQYNLGHGMRVDWIQKRLDSHHPGLHLGGNAYLGISLNDCVEQASVLAERLCRNGGTSEQKTDETENLSGNN